MNILLLMAGASDVYAEAGYRFPKNLIEIQGKPLIQHAIENLRSLLTRGSHLLVMLKRDETIVYHTDEVVRLLAPGCTVCEVAGETNGAACTALLAIEHINNDLPLVIVNGDQVIDADLSGIMADFAERRFDGGIIVFEDVHPRWSFVKCGTDGLVIEAAEKRPISRLATAGFYYFARGEEFARAAMRMITKDASVNGNFYVCPAYNELILHNARIGIHQIPRSAYFSLATPQGAEAYGQNLKEKQTA